MDKTPDGTQQGRAAEDTDRKVGRGGGDAPGSDPALLAALLDLHRDATALIRVDPPGAQAAEPPITIVYANAAMLARAGLRAEDLPTRLDDFARNLRTPGPLERLRGHLARREAFRLATVVKLNDQPPYEIEAEGTILATDPDGTVWIGVVSRRISDDPTASRLRAAVETISDGFLLIDPDDRVLIANRRFREFFPELEDLLQPGIAFDALARHAMEIGLFPEAEGKESTWWAERRTRLRSDPEGFEYKLRNGRWVRVREARTPDGWTVSLRTDITTEKENARLQAESERRFRILAESSPIGIFQTDLHGKLVYANPKLADLCGMTPEEMRDLGWHGCVHPDDLPTVMGLIGTGTPAQERMGYDVRVRGRWASVLAAVLRDGDGEPVGIIGSVIDTHERRLMEAALRSSEERYRRIIETAQEGIMVNDANGVIRFVNPRLAAMVGFTPAEMIGHPMYAFLDPEAGEIIRRKHSHRALGISEQYELQLRRPDGSKGWMLISSTPVTTADGQFDGALAMVIDITERHQADEALARHVAELEGSRRELEQLARRYEQEKRRAEESNRSKSRFLSSMSHELRTPLNSILGFSDILRNPRTGPADEGLRGYANDIHAAGAYLLDLINDILDMSKIEAGKYEIRIGQVQTRRLFEDTARMLRQNAADRQIDLRTVLADDLPDRFLADGRAVRQVLLNLLSNGLKFTQRGGSVTLAAHIDGPDLVIGVTDTGIGIAPKDLERLGRPFEQVDNALNRRHQGTGLGLALSKALVEMHGGTLTIASTPGQGTTVTARLPLEGPPQKGSAALEAAVIHDP